MISECEKILLTHPGDIVEIGAGYGENTIKFLTLAEKYDRQVIVIDPFETGWHQMPRYSYDLFCKITDEFKSKLVVHKLNSLSEEAEIICRNTNIAFAYIDGLQYKGAVLSDLRIVSHAVCICVDNMDRVTGESHVPATVKQFVAECCSCSLS